MKKYLIVAFLTVISLSYAVSQNIKTESNDQDKATEITVPVTYTCSMHPEINTNKPGPCPKCGMDLIQKSAPLYSCPMHPEITGDAPGKCPKCEMALEVKPVAQYTCSMHPEVVGDAAGKCPKCGMAMELKSQAIYSCPMHPEITSQKSGKCPKCGMELTKGKATGHKMKGCCNM